ncbi:MAG: WbqC family protein [Candidatus Poribacteria bacterium]|nr:WbqC family protein [Candidatus Poribacteria bacterium]
MIVSVHQPQYLPWLGYFDKIDRSDLFVFLDNVQYKKREFQNRNRIRTPSGDVWLTVPVQTKGRYNQPIREVHIDNTADWRKKHWQSIAHSYQKAPHFSAYKDALELLYHSTWEKLDVLNQFCVRLLMKRLNILTPVVLESELDVSSTRTERIIEICQQVGASTYLSGAGGQAYIDTDRFGEAEIELVYQHYSHPVYPQIHDGFVPYMSVIDLLFNCRGESLRILRGEA